MAVYMKEIGMKNLKDMDLELIDGKMVQFILDTGKIMLPVDMVNWFMKTEISMKETGKTTRLMATVNIYRRTGLFLKVLGRMINNMGRG